MFSSLPLCHGRGEARKRQPSGPSVRKENNWGSVGGKSRSVLVMSNHWRALGASWGKSNWFTPPRCQGRAPAEPNVRSSCPQQEGQGPSDSQLCHWKEKIKWKEQFCCLPTYRSPGFMYVHKETWLFFESHPKNQLCYTTVCSMTHVTIFTPTQAVRDNKAKTQLKRISWNMVFSNSFLLNLDFSFSENEWHLKPAFSPVNVKINTDSLIFCKPTLFVFWVGFLFAFELGKKTQWSVSPLYFNSSLPSNQISEGKAC